MEVEDIVVQGKNYYNLSVEEVLSEFSVERDKGLTESEASSRLEIYGPNVLPKAKRSFYSVYIAPFFENTLIIIYLIAAVAMLLFSIIAGINSYSPYITFFVVIFNALTAIIQQARAQKSLNALRQMSKAQCTVIRDGMKKTIDASLVVPGDILDLQEGDKIPADARVIEANNLYVNESSITGESVPINKFATALEQGFISMQDQRNILFKGTFVTKGNGRAVVFHTGANTEIGRISKNLGALANEEVPLKQKINKFANYLGILVGIMFVVSWSYVLIANWLAGTLEQNFWADLVDSIDLALKFIPINLVLLATIILITGVLAMAAKGVVVRNLTSIESLGRASVVCTDKTGTLTQNAMTIQHVWANHKLFDVMGTGYSKEGYILLKGKKISRKDYKSLEYLVISGLMNNNAEIYEEKRKVTGKDKDHAIVQTVVGDPMEAALDILAEKLRVNEQELLQHLKFVKEYPFDSELKRMTKVWESDGTEFKKGYIAFVKGATEIILDRSTTLMVDEDQFQPLDAETRDQIINANNEWARKGYRTLGMAMRYLDSIPEGDSQEGRDEIEKDLIFLGFVVIQDPPREGVKEAVESCENAGVTVVMITGDSAVTGAAIGAELGIYTEGEKIVEGSEIKNLSDEEFIKTAIFARVSPDDKQIIVKRYQDQGRVVAMTGDGVNDALALSMADVGLAMGITGTEVAKDAADMIISDDSFNTIALGIREGRGLFAKIRVMMYFFVYANLTEAIILFALSFIHKDFRLFDTALQIQLIYVLPHSLPPLGLSFDRTSLDIMKEKPRDEEEIFNKHVLQMMMIHIIYLASALLIVSIPVVNAFIAQLDSNLAITDLYAMNHAMAKPRTVVLAVIFVVEAATVFCVRRPNIPVYKSFRRDMSPLLVLFVCLTFGGLLAVIYVPGINDLFLLAPLDLSDWGIVLLVGLPSVLVLELFKYYKRTRHSHF